MPPRNPKVFLEGLAFAEGPRWHDGRLWFSDIHAHEVVAVDMRGKRETIVSVPQKPSGLGWLPDGRLLVVSMLDRRLMRLDPGGLIEAANLSASTTGLCNDMVVDVRGRAYIGATGFDMWKGEPFKPAAVVTATQDGKTRIVTTDLHFPNGMAITPDGRTLIVAESRGGRLTAFAIAPDGALSDQRVWAQLEGAPDGICLDSEGCVWVALAQQPGGGYIRVARGGAVKERIDVADRRAIACMLGGPQRKTLFMLEAFQTTPDSVRGNSRITTVDVDVSGTGLP
ncbi:MAG: hypothetical protein EXR60_04020 [Dehalococcoidia bacterium]|nr:hypothetical protein [Dehalococcoidia bacterium]